MQYLQSKNKAKQFSDQVIARIEKDDLSPTPLAFEVLYVFYGKLDPELVRSIEILEEKGEVLNDEICQDLYGRFLSQESQNERVQKAGNQMNMTIQAVGGIVNNVKAATTEYNVALETTAAKLSEDIGIEEARGALKEVVDTTKNMLEQNAKLEQALDQSDSLMKELQEDLERVRKEAMTDALTGLANRKAFDAAIIEQCEKSQNEGEIFSFVIFDIDHFKDFNDSYGHQVGDQVLRLVGKTLYDGVKGKDMVARYGGEEFVLILPNTRLQDAIQLSTSLRLAVAGKEVVNRATQTKMGRITLSGGVAEFVKGESSEDIIARADQALLSAKRSGRNQVLTAADPAPVEEAG